MSDSNTPPDRSNFSISNLSKALQSIMEKATPFQRAIVSVGTLIDILVLGSIPFTPSNYRALLVGLGLLLLFVIAITIAIVHSSDVISNPLLESRKHKNEKVETMKEIDCEAIKRRLDAAKKILNALEMKAAGYPKTERPATLEVDLDEKRAEVKMLERMLLDCLGGNKNGK